MGLVFLGEERTRWVRCSICLTHGHESRLLSLSLSYSSDRKLAWGTGHGLLTSQLPRDTECW